MSASDRLGLHEAAQRFCDDFARKESTESLLRHFSAQCELLEHGLPVLAPFLGSPFTGLGGVRCYFSTLAGLIAYDNMHFSEYFLDTDLRKVSVKGSATFTWLSTQQSWHETFTYVLDLDDNCKIIRYQIWGDTGALYLAKQGRLS